MDEEDIADAEEARKLQTSESFAGLGLTQDEVTQRGTFMDILKTSGDTMGVKLLRRMGWRDGQGVGPKVRRKARLDGDGDQGDEEGQETHLFAPENSPMIFFVRKNDHKGLGYAGQEQLGELIPQDHTKGRSNLVQDDDAEMDAGDFARPAVKVKKKSSTRRGGLGVGILNDTGSDDEDPYHMGPQISYNRVIGGDKKAKKKTLGNGKPSVASANPLLHTKPVFISKKAAISKNNSGFRRCHDGRLPLDGYVLSSNSEILHEENKHPPPTIPKDWKSSKNTSDVKHPSSYQSPADVARSSTMNATTRANLLGEAPLPGKSVFDYLSISARSRIANATNNPNLPAALNEALPPGHTPSPGQRTTDLASLVPSLDATIAATALGRGIGGWMPYAEDPAKRSRYRSFLSVSARITEGLPERAEGMKTEDWTKEMQEFAHAAQIFKPMTGMMASRFTPSTSQDPTLNPNPSSAPSAATQSAQPQPLLSHSIPKPPDPAEEAARLGMYGPLTRSTTPFYPSRLLCKRFNIQPPAHVHVDPSSSTSSSNPAQPSSGAATFGARFQSSGYQTQTGKNLELVGKKEMEELRRESGITVEEGGEANGKRMVDPERNEALETERPGEAVFRAIFGSDSEGEE